MNQAHRRQRQTRRLQAEKGVLGKLAWGGVFLSLVAFAYYLSGIFILFGASSLFILASYHFKYHFDDRPHLDYFEHSQLFEYIDGSNSGHAEAPVSLDSRNPERHSHHSVNTKYFEHPTSLLKVLRRCLEQESDHASRPMHALAQATLEALDGVVVPVSYSSHRPTYHSRDRISDDYVYVNCTHRAREWNILEELRDVRIVDSDMRRC